ncbi:AtpZ/AtpI family protein [Paenibacillus phoenicis]|uniref:AtpZ/AtpI family protein n=1 Tax=Paenibacillus phoenicis TaxID=554117 RepID=A0ABU5PN78_9BACL|nr:MULTISPECIES: AtpZ/AtpI family protein [Paenibacillus]MCT2195810.1 AtpZ/AtpI family protein [Paenibacillus sp. p3-SID1389]MEA3571408.1 AtpZ/AtpI family protein [Paenibacillus phoenicis]
MKDPIKPDKNNNSVWKAVAVVTALGTNFAVCAVGGYFLGAWLDKLWFKNGLGIGLGVLIGIAAGIIGIVALIKSVVGGNDG